MGRLSTFANPAVNSRIQFVSVNSILKKLFFPTRDAALSMQIFKTGQFAVVKLCTPAMSQEIT